jgi:hypothetical protein
MKTQLSKRSRTKAGYTEEYKQEALELWRKSGRSAAKSQVLTLLNSHCGKADCIRASEFPCADFLRSILG